MKRRAYKDEDHGHFMVASQASLVAVVIVFVVLRLIGKVRKSGLWWDDYTLVFSWFTTLAASGLIIHQVCNQGLGKHFSALSPDQVSSFLKFRIICGILVMASGVWTKTSFGLSILRIASTIVLRRIVILVVSTMNLFLLTQLTFLLLFCRPPQKLWKPEVEGSCLNTEALLAGAMVLAAYSGIIDLLLSYLPYHIIRGLHITKNEKIGLIAAMSLGIFAGIASFIKCAYYPRGVGSDPTYNIHLLLLWSVAEPCVTMIAASVPIIRILVRDTRRSTAGAGIGGRHVLSPRASHRLSRLVSDGLSIHYQNGSNGVNLICDAKRDLKTSATERSSMEDQTPIMAQGEPIPGSSGSDSGGVVPLAQTRTRRSDTSQPDCSKIKVAELA